jgi:hypothetical protein
MDVPSSFTAKFLWLERHFRSSVPGDKGIVAADYLIADSP